MTSPTRLLFALALAAAASTAAHAADKIAAQHLSSHVHRVPDSQLVFDPAASAREFASIGDAPATILVLDELNTRFEEVDFIHRTAIQYLTTQPAELAQPTALLVVSNSRLVQLSGFTRDRDALVAGIEQRVPEYPAKMAARQSTQFARMSASLQALNRIGEAARGGKGRKNLVWIGNGYAPVPDGELMAGEESNAQRAVHYTAHGLRAGQIALYGLRPAYDVASPVELSLAGGIALPDADSGKTEKGTIQFSDLAAATGGESRVADKRASLAIGRAIVAASELASRPAEEVSNTVETAAPPPPANR